VKTPRWGRGQSPAFPHKMRYRITLRQTAAGACGSGGNVDGLASFRHPEIIYRLVETPSARKTPGAGVDSGRLLAWKAAHGSRFWPSPAWSRAS
jgi:hypothetical protein